MWTNRHTPHRLSVRTGQLNSDLDDCRLRWISFLWSFSFELNFSSYFMSVYARILLHLFSPLKGIWFRSSLQNSLQRFDCIKEISCPLSFRGDLMNRLKHLNAWMHGLQDLHHMRNFYHLSQTIVLFCRIVSLFDFFISYYYEIRNWPYVIFHYEIMNHCQT